MQSSKGKLQITVLPRAYTVSNILCVVFIIGARLVLGLSLWESLVFGASALLIYWGSAFIHHVGHILAARTTGYPIVGLRFGTFGGWLSTDVYPFDEPPLSPSIHVRRALGGPIASALLALLFGLMAYVLSQNEITYISVWYWLTIFGLLINLLVYFGQAFIPLGFNDGSVLWRYWLGR
jgi:hypothetical protein